MKAKVVGEEKNLLRNMSVVDADTFLRYFAQLAPSLAKRVPNAGTMRGGVALQGRNKALTLLTHQTTLNSVCALITSSC
jgi:hypothetical protein